MGTNSENLHGSINVQVIWNAGLGAKLFKIDARLRGSQLPQTLPSLGPPFCEANAA